MPIPELGAAVVAGQVAPQDEAGAGASALVGAVLRARWSARAGVEVAAGLAGGQLDPRVELVSWIGDPSADVVPRFAGGGGISVPVASGPLAPDAPMPFVDFGVGLDATLLPVLDARVDGRVRIDAEGLATLVFSVGPSFHGRRAYDRDADGVSDRSDRCLSDPEDRDGFEDDDGCPDPDDDGDRLPDANDPCPRIAEDRDGFLDADGCPEPDNDGDGLDDPLDACTNAPEDPDGFEDGDGCPDTDNDRDGVIDDDDACPNVPEDLDGHQDPDGCPDPDNDGDGVGDRFDGAPGAPETRNGWQDADGIPDELPPLLARFTGPQPRIRFDGNALSERGADAVETLADVLVTYPEVRVRVGVRDTELGRAESRAVTVAGALAQHGIVPERVVPYGEEGEPRVWIEILLEP